MAYSDYGGYAFRNGERIDERSDAVFTTEGIKSTPGMWPGFILPEGRSGMGYHALLGDGPVFVGMYKQTYQEVFAGSEQVDLEALLVGKYPQHVGDWREDAGHDYDKFIDADETASIEVNGHLIEIKWVSTDNYYQFVRLTQPNGVVWTGFSGYGIGAGLEDCGYGYSTSRAERLLRTIFPASEGDSYA